MGLNKLTVEQNLEKAREVKGITCIWGAARNILSYRPD